MSTYVEAVDQSLPTGHELTARLSSDRTRCVFVVRADQLYVELELSRERTHELGVTMIHMAAAMVTP